MASHALKSPAHPSPKFAAAAFFSSSSRPGIGLVSVAVAHGRSGILPHFKGLRASAPRGKLRSAAVADTMKAICRSTVVCEARQEAAIEDLTKATWQSLVIECDKPVIVEFWASWCEPCRIFHPVISKLSETYQGNIRFFRLNTDENPEIAAQYEIKSIPTAVIFKNGEKMERIIGAVSESILVTFIQGYVD